MARVKTIPLSVVILMIRQTGGTPPISTYIDVGDAIVVWQPDGEVKTLRRKP